MRKKRFKKGLASRKRGYTLIEVIAVITILGVLVLLAMPNFLSTSRDIKGKEISNNILMMEYSVNNETVMSGEDDILEGLTEIDPAVIKKAFDEDRLFTSEGFALLYDLGYKFYDLGGLDLAMDIDGSTPGSYAINETEKIFFISDETIKTMDEKIPLYGVIFDTDGGDIIEPFVGYEGDPVDIPPDPTRIGHTFTGWDPEIPNVLPAENITVLAKWLINQYTISFDTDGGTPIDPVTQDYASVVTPPENPTKTGYTFGGWSPEMPALIPAEDTTMVAGWIPNDYVISFDSNGGSAPLPASKTVSFDSTYGTFPTVNKTGHSFKGWYDAAIGGNQIAEATTMNTPADHTLYAQWDANTYTVSLNGNGGSTPISEITVTFGGEYGSLPTPTRTGYTFTGWFTNSADGEEITSSTIVTTAGNDALYAQWTPNVYTVTFDANGGNTPTTSKQVTYASTYGTLPIPTRSGYTFAGWHDAITGGTEILESSNVDTTSDQTLYARWTPNLYTVTFDGNGGNTPTPSKTVTYGSTYGTLPVPTRTGYTFNGWFSAASGGTKTIETTSVDIYSNHTLYAQWTPKVYTVIFNANGGSTSTASKQVTYASTYGTLPTPTRTGYTFSGWHTSVSGGTNILATTNVATTTNQTLYAQWTPNLYTVTFDGNGGNSPTANKAVTFASTYGTLPTPARTGYTFNGWYTSASGGTKIVSTTGVSTASNHLLYAQWTPKTYTVTFNGNGGSSPTVNKSVTYDSTYGTLPTPTRTGYNFSGWYTAASGGSKIISTTSVTITANQTLYAQWTPKTYTVTFNGNGGSSPTANKTVTYASTYGTLPTPTRTGYAFTGWYTATSGGTRILSTTGVSITANQTLYARWVVQTYTLNIIYEIDYGTGDPVNPPPSVTMQLKYGDPYDVRTPRVGNASQPADVVGTMPANNLTLRPKYYSYFEWNTLSSTKVEATGLTPTGVTYFNRDVYLSAAAGYTHDAVGFAEYSFDTRYKGTDHRVYYLDMTVRLDYIDRYAFNDNYIYTVDLPTQNSIIERYSFRGNRLDVNDGYDLEIAETVTYLGSGAFKENYIVETYIEGRLYDDDRGVNIFALNGRDGDSSALEDFYSRSWSGFYRHDGRRDEWYRP